MGRCSSSGCLNQQHNIVNKIVSLEGDKELAEKVNLRLMALLSAISFVCSLRRFKLLDTIRKFE